MTTAARPTFDPAQGGSGRNESTDLSRVTKQYSSRDMPSHTKLKYRQPGQDTTDELRARDLHNDLEERERGRDKEKRSRDAAKKPRLDQVTTGNLDADDALDEDADEDSDEDDTAELMAELNRIKKERAAEEAKLEAERKAEEARIRTENILSGNPLLNPKQGTGSAAGSDFKVKRRWDDDVVFKNCAKGVDERQADRSFINDSLRSEFHKKFMSKYIK